VAENTQGAQVVEVALSTPFRDGQDMIGVPQTLAVQPLEPPFGEKPQPVGPAGAPQFAISRASVRSADRANAAVPLQDLLAKVPGIGAEPPFVHTPIRTERKAPRRDLQTAPAAQRASVAAFRQGSAIGEAAPHGP